MSVIRAHNMIAVLQIGCKQMFEKVKEIDPEICVYDVLEFSNVEMSENSVTIKYFGSVENYYELTCEYLIEQSEYIINVNKKKVMEKESKVETIKNNNDNG